ncbi:DUF2339 domain-containing protein [Nocardia sp. R6R-6]|uniref:DUF2339 domain-containing protein n=1 Tax=Nocardia sp. R6R-6 TaxID=3459303 RepID=UPI00403D6633
MTTVIDPALLARISREFTTLGTRLGVLGHDLDLLREQVAADYAAGQGVTGEPGRAAPGSAGAPKTRAGQEWAPGWPGDPAQRGSALGAPASGGPDEPNQRVSAPRATGDPASDRSTRAPVSDAISGAAEGVSGATSPAAFVAGGSAESGRVAPATPSASMPSVPPATPPWPGHSPMTGAPVPSPQPAYVSRFAPSPGAGAPWAPTVRGPVPPRPPVPPRAAGPRVPRTPWWQRDGVISRILAVAGVAVTLIGVAMLLVLAAQAGFFGPVPRVVGGGVFSVALVGAGVRVFGRTGGRVGGIALAATGIAGAYLDVVALTTIYHWLHPVLGLAVAFGVAAAGVGLAMRWRSQPLAVLVVLAAAALSPVLTTRLVLLAFLIVLQVACVPVQLPRDWPYLHVARTLPAGLATFVFLVGALAGTPTMGERAWLLVAAAAVALAGLAGTLIIVRHRPTDLTASLTMAAALVPMLIAPGMYEQRITVTLVASVTAAVLLLVAALPIMPKLGAHLRIPGHTAVVAAVAGSIALLEACVGVSDPKTLPIALLVVALVSLGVAGGQRSRIAAGIGAAFAVLGGFTLLQVAGPTVLVSQDRSAANLGSATVLGAVLALGVVAVALWCARRLPGMAAAGEAQWVAASVAGLYAVTAATVSIGIETGARNGFLIGHSVATILWMAGATGALLFGLRRLAGAPAVAKLALGSGLLVTAAALAKLFLFDLATLDGLVRVAAFLIVGILLLLAGTRYARAFADSGTNSDAGDAAAPGRR